MLLLCLQHVVFNYSLYFAGRFGVYCLVMLFVEVDAKVPQNKKKKSTNRVGLCCFEGSSIPRGYLMVQTLWAYAIGQEAFLYHRPSSAFQFCVLRTTKSFGANLKSLSRKKKKIVDVLRFPILRLCP